MPYPLLKASYASREEDWLYRRYLGHHEHPRGLVSRWAIDNVPAKILNVVNA